MFVLNRERRRFVLFGERGKDRIVREKRGRGYLVILVDCNEISSSSLIEIRSIREGILLSWDYKWLRATISVIGLLSHLLKNMWTLPLND